VLQLEDKEMQRDKKLVSYDSTSNVMSACTHIPPHHTPTFRFEDKEVQRDKKLFSYDIIDKQGKPYVKVQVGKEDKVCFDRWSA
jgi:hypothetical protein